VSIETVLTILVAAALLVGAALLRLLAIGIFRVARGLWVNFVGDARTGTARLEDALPGPSLRERGTRVLEGAGALSLYVVAIAARGLGHVGEGIRVAFRAIWYALVAAYAWLSPRLKRAFGRLEALRDSPVPVLVQRSSAARPATTRQLARVRANLGSRAGAS